MTINNPVETADMTNIEDPVPTVDYTSRKMQDLEIAPISCHESNQDRSARDKQDYPDSEMDDWDWDEMEASPFKETTTAIKRPVKTPPPTENNHEVEGGNMKDDYSDHEVDNLDWDVLEHPPDRDTETKLDNTSRLPSGPTCEQRQAHWLLCQDRCGCKNSLPSLVEKTRIVKDYGLRNGKANLISNMYIAVGEIAAVFGETSTVWAQDDVDELDRIAIQYNTIGNAQQFEFYVSGDTQGNQGHFHIIPAGRRTGPIYGNQSIPQTLVTKQIYMKRRGAICEAHVLQTTPKR